MTLLGTALMVKKMDVGMGLVFVCPVLLALYIFGKVIFILVLVAPNARTYLVLVGSISVLRAATP